MNATANTSATAWPGRDRTTAVSPSEAQALAHDLRVLADPARIRILSIASSHPGRPTTVTELVDALTLTQATVSHHLRVLLDAGFLARERSGTWSLYRVVEPRMRELAGRLGPDRAPEPAIAPGIASDLPATSSSDPGAGHSASH